MDEGTEVKDARQTALSAELIPGMAVALRWLRAQGYPLALVADARADTPLNVLKQHGLLDLFDCLSVSETVGAEKPDARLFLHALQALQIPEQDYARVMMVGNNLERDIAGANGLGLRSVYFHVNDRRRSIPGNRAEAPRHTVETAQELLDLVATLSVEVARDQPPRGLGKAEEQP